MRPIKFRAWEEDGRNMLSPEEVGDHTLNDLTDGLPFVLMQFTGLHDINGKEIYEGDIVIAKFYNPIQQCIKSRVEFQNGCFGIVPLEDAILIDSLGKFRSFDGCTTEKLIEVIGNIYENSDLLSKNAL